MKEKMLARLERDRAVGQAAGLQSTLKSAENLKGSAASLRGVQPHQSHCIVMLLRSLLR